MVTVKDKIKAISTCFGKYKLSSTGKNINVSCPVCKKNGKITSKKKLSIDIEAGIYHCWVCETKGSNIGKLSHFYCDDKNKTTLLYNLYKKKNAASSQDVLEQVEDRPKLPEDFRLVHNQKNSLEYRRHYEYLLARGFDESKMKKFRVGVSSEYSFKNRVIFPSFDLNHDLNYYVSRSIDPDVMLRYKNYQGKRKSVIFNHVDLDFKQPLVLVEGVFDLVNCPTNSTCILGSWLSPEHLLFHEIARNRTPVILCLDPDAIGKTIKIAKLLNEYCVDVKISLHKNSDFGDSA